jgi:hypothetical protein
LFPTYTKISRRNLQWRCPRSLKNEFLTIFCVYGYGYKIADFLALVLNLYTEKSQNHTFRTAPLKILVEINRDI